MLNKIFVVLLLITYISYIVLSAEGSQRTTMRYFVAIRIYFGVLPASLNFRYSHCAPTFKVEVYTILSLYLERKACALYFC